VYFWLIWQLSPSKISSIIPPCGNQPKMLSKFMASYQIMSLGYETFWWWHILTRVHHRCKLENYGTTWWNSLINTTQWIHYKENITYSINSMVELKVCKCMKIVCGSYHKVILCLGASHLLTFHCGENLQWFIFGYLWDSFNHYRWGMVLTYRFTLHLMGL
jgi:hypothetical protein